MVQCSVLSAACTVERTAGVAGVDFIDSVLCGFPHQLPCTSEIGQVCSSEVWETQEVVLCSSEVWETQEVVL